MIGNGSQVLVQGAGSVGTVLSIQNGFANVSVGSQTAWHPIDELTDVSDRLLSRLMEGDLDSPLKFILATDANRLLTKYKFDPYVLASSTKIAIYPHQINEAIWGIDNRRMMIADEVGLGKTIIAALIASELKARGMADRVLYVVPSPLVLKWQDELNTKFDTDVTILNSNYVKFNNDPFSAGKFDFVTSMDFLKFEKYRRLIRKIDLVVVDEAHKFKPGNERYELGEILSEKADAMIFLTATPHDGKDENFLGRMSLLDPFVTDVSSASHLWTRHIKENVVDMNGREVFPKRSSTTVDTRLTNNERAVHRMLDKYIQDRRSEVRNPQDLGAVRFLGVILRKRAASSLRSLRNTLERRREKIGTAKIQKAPDPDDMEHDDDYEDRAEKYEYVHTGADIEREKGSISAMINAIDRLGNTDSKFDKLVELVKNVKRNDANAKILLFTEYRDTIDYLEGRLAGTYRTGRIDGTMDMATRKAALEEFSSDGGPEMLLCTDAAGEGVDMQFCNIEFNYDIPWNPNRLEQRMGRIHRIGQDRDVRYFNFVVDRQHTIDGMIHGMLLDKINNIKEAMGDDSVFDVLGRIVSEDMINRIYEELEKLPHELWEPKIKAELDEIERIRADMKQKTDQFLAGKSLDRTMLEDMRKIKMRAVDAGDVGRFLETWTEFNDGKYDVHGDMVRIRTPRHMARRIGGIVQGTLDGKIARNLNKEYLALGNKKVHAMLKDSIGRGSVALLGHGKRSGLLCVYNRSVICGDGTKDNAETVMVFCNEDGAAEVVDASSVWDYEEAGPREAGRPLNTGLLAKMKKLADERMADDSVKFHDKSTMKLGKMRDMAIDMVDVNVAAEVEKQSEKIAEWMAKKHTAPHYARLISEAKNKIRRKMDDGERRKGELESRFTSHLAVELVGIAAVTPKADANARTMSDRAGMEIVLRRERRRAKTAEERRQVRDVSDRDTGYDIETKHRSIEVKSFEGHPNPRMTSHEWMTAKKFGDRYWLYVVENVHAGAKVTEIQDPHKTLADIIVEEHHTVGTYRFDWATWKGSLGSTGSST